MKIKLLALLLSLLFILSSCGTSHTHEYTEYLVSDGTHHWFECGCGDKKDVSEHDFDSGVIAIYPTTEREGVKILTCLVCDYEKTEKIDKLAADHVHEFSNVYSSDETHHWYECVCGERKENAQHAFGGGIITTAPTVNSEGVMTYTCSVCRYEKSEVIEKLDPDHTEHEFSYTYSSDEKSHWYQCVCGVKGNLADHNWGDGEVILPAGELESGIKAFTCSDCGRKKTEIIPSSKVNGLSFQRDVHHTISNRLAKTPLTLEAEIRVDKNLSGKLGAIFGNYYGIRQDWLFEIVENGVPRFYYSDAAGNHKDYLFDRVDVRTGEWMHIALTFDFENRALTLYINGEVKQVLTLETDLAEDITRYGFVLAGDRRYANENYFHGQIRSLAVYSDVRTATEIKTSKEEGINLYADNIILCYLLNEGIVNEDIADVTGNGYTIPKSWLDSHEPDIDYAYSFAVIGDTQWLSKYSTAKMEGIYDWILENQESKKIAHVFGLGDITEDWNTAGKEQEWIRAHQYISKLNGIIPYSLVRGNHDEAKYFNKYFATEEYMSQYNGYFMTEGDVTNSYKLFTIGSTDYLSMTLDYGASDEILAWANAVVLAHPNHRVIVTTHGYQGCDGDRLTYDNVSNGGDITSATDVNTNVGEPPRGYNNGQAMWEKFVSRHPNIFLLLNGHAAMDDVVLLQSEGNHGNVVNQMLIDPQWLDPMNYNGIGMVCMLYFTEDGSQMSVEWISTDTGKYYKEQNQFTLDLTDSINAPAHDFHDSYDAKHHYLVCDCGYAYNEQPHEFDGGYLNSDGFMVYTCDCGYQRTASATDDPIAKALQEMLEKFYNGGTYYKNVSGIGTTFYGGNEFWTTDRNDSKRSADYLTLYDLVMGKCGDLKLDIGWNYNDGVYYSANESTVKGARMFLLSLKNGDTSACNATKVSVEENGYQVIIKLWDGSTVLYEATVGVYATVNLENLQGDSLGQIYAETDADALCRITTPKKNGYVSEYDSLILDARYDDLEITVYYSTVAVWDGVSVSTSLKGSGTADDPFLVESGADLAYMAKVINESGVANPNFSGKYFLMTQSIDLGGHDLFVGAYTGWSSRKGFFGLFDGNHCTIRGLDQAGALFGTIETGWLKNLSVYGKISNSTHEAVGGIVGYVYNGGRLENLTSYVTVNGQYTLGGIVGNAEDGATTVINCVNYGNVTGSSWNIGGIAGSGGHDITDCKNFGKVHSTGSDNVGGIAGSTKKTGSISGCINYGAISSAHGRVGGIVGLGQKPIVNCINYGEISAGWDNGGILGFVGDGASASVTGCINYGKVTGNTGLGGIFGFNHANAGAIAITDCVNNGEVKGTWGVGGIAGNTKATISGCINNGTIVATGELGGIVGKCYGNVTECTNNGVVSGAQTIIGGIVGHLHVTTYIDVINSTNYQNGTVEGPTSEQIIGRVE